MRTTGLRFPLVVLLVTVSIGTNAADEHSSKGSGGWNLYAHDQATAADVGLPAYPGARPYRENSETQSSANLGFSSPAFGIELVVASFATNDQPERVAEFYRKALSRYGDVVNCSDPANRKSAKNRDDDLSCDSSDAKKIVYKVGTKKNLHIVSVETVDECTRYSMVYIRVRD